MNNSNVDFAELIGTVETPDVKEHMNSFNRQNSETLSTRSSSSISLNTPSAEEGHETIEKDQGAQLEASSKGTVKGSISVNYFNAGAHWTMLLIMFSSFILAQLLASGTDYWVSTWLVDFSIRSKSLFVLTCNLGYK